MAKKPSMPKMPAAPKKIVLFQLLFLILLIGFAAWLFSALGTFTSAVSCIVEQIVVIKSVKGEAGKSLASLSAAVPDALIAQLQQSLSLLAIFVIVPAAVIFVVQTILVFCAWSTKKGASACQTKFMICVLTIFCLLGFVFYIIVGGIGIVSNSPEGQAATASVTDTCTNVIPDARATVTDTQATLASYKAAGITGKELNDAQFEVDEADKAITAIETICTCFSNLLPALAGLVAPGFACAVVCLILLILDCCTCCALGCCGKPKGSPKGNTAVDQQAGAVGV